MVVERKAVVGGRREEQEDSKAADLALPRRGPTCIAVVHSAMSGIDQLRQVPPHQSNVIPNTAMTSLRQSPDNSAQIYHGSYRIVASAGRLTWLGAEDKVA